MMLLEIPEAYWVVDGELRLVDPRCVPVSVLAGRLGGEAVVADGKVRISDARETEGSLDEGGQLDAAQDS